MVALKGQGLTEDVSVTHINALTREQFVLKLLDEMVNREMRLMADDILSYVGTNIGRANA